MRCLAHLRLGPARARLTWRVHMPYRSAAVLAVFLTGGVLISCVDDAAKSAGPNRPLAVVQTDPVCEAVQPARCYYVDSARGNDANLDGTFALPWKSFKNISTYYDVAYHPPNTWHDLQPGD